MTPTKADSVLRRQKDGTRIEFSSPESVSLYNKYMGGVDLNDQLRGYYHVTLKCRKVYKYVLFMFDVAITLSSSYRLTRQECQGLQSQSGQVSNRQLLLKETDWSPTNNPATKTLLPRALSYKGIKHKSQVSLLPYLPGSTPLNNMVL